MDRLYKNYEILTQPFINVSDIAEMTGRSKSTIHRHIKKHNLVNYGWGYETQKVIKIFGMKDYFKWLVSTFQKKKD